MLGAPPLVSPVCRGPSYAPEPVRGDGVTMVVAAMVATAFAVLIRSRATGLARA